MKPRLLLIIGMIVMSSSLITDGYACSCEGYPEYLRILMDSNTAFQGTVTKIIQKDHTEEVYFDIIFPQKGSFQTEEHMIEQSKRSSCAVNYKIGETYQVFTYNDDVTLGTTNMCSTKQITGFNEYSHEDENGNMEYFREDFNILTQYNLGTIIFPISAAIVIPILVVWRKRR